MSTDFQFFEERDWLNPLTTCEPLIWIKEVRILRCLEAGEDAEIRRITLHRGLNIVWAKPADPDEPNPSERGRGHDVGKTTFCRLIRFLLGEDPYGSESFRAGVAANESLSRAWVVGEVLLDGEPWAVARALYPGAHHFAIKGRTVDEGREIPKLQRCRGFQIPILLFRLASDAVRA